MADPEIQWTSTLDHGAWGGERVVVRLGGELVALVPLSDLRKLEAFELMVAEGGAPEPREPARKAAPDFSREDDD